MKTQKTKVQEGESDRFAMKHQPDESSALAYVLVVNGINETNKGTPQHIM